VLYKSMFAGERRLPPGSSEQPVLHLALFGPEGLISFSLQPDWRWYLIRRKVQRPWRHEDKTCQKQWSICGYVLFHRDTFAHAGKLLQVLPVTASRIK